MVVFLDCKSEHYRLEAFCLFFVVFCVWGGGEGGFSLCLYSAALLYGLSSSRYDLHNIGRDINHRIVIINQNLRFEHYTKHAAISFCISAQSHLDFYYTPIYYSIQWFCYKIMKALSVARMRIVTFVLLHICYDGNT